MLKFALAAILVLVGLTTANAQVYGSFGVGVQVGVGSAPVYQPQTQPYYRANPVALARPYAGALRRGGCEDPRATFINEQVGCVFRDSNPQHMERYRGKISDICGGRHGAVQMPLPDGGRATYNCP